jgi:hypothetical protein
MGEYKRICLILFLHLFQDNRLKLMTPNAEHVHKVDLRS